MSVGRRLATAIEKQTAQQMAGLPTVKVGEVISQQGELATVRIGTVEYTNVQVAVPVPGMVNGAPGQRVLCQITSGEPVILGFLDQPKDLKLLRRHLWTTM